MSVKCLSSQSPCSNLSLVLPKSGSSSFPGETKLLLYHSGPQVFQCSLTVSCKRRGTGNICWCQSLTAPRTNALCNASTFSKGSRVPYHWLRSQLACNSILLRLIDQTHNETLFVFFFFLSYLITTSFQLQLCGLELTVPTKDQRTNVFHMSGWPPECDHSVWGGGGETFRIASGFPKFRL